MKFSKITGCFYPDDIQYSNLPADLIPVPADDYSAAMSRKPGATLDVRDGKLIVVPPPAPDPIAILALAKVNGLARIDAYGKAQRVKIAGTPDEIEIAAWNNKLVIAKAIKAGTASAGDKAAFQAEINARGKGETVDAFADKVLVNASFYAQAVGLIDGLKRRTQDAVNAANTPEEVETVLAAMKSQAEAAFAQLMGAAK
jgi:hypothetical protein